MVIKNMLERRIALLANPENLCLSNSLGFYIRKLICLLYFKWEELTI